MKRQDVVSTLKKLLPVCQAGERRLEALANRAEDTLEKAIYIHYWQKYAQCTCEMEDKIRMHGGEINAPDSEPLAVPDGDAATAYEQVLQLERLPVDVRMLLQRQILVFKEGQKRIDALQTTRHHPAAPLAIPSLLNV